MVERRPPKALQRYQPLPSGQTIIILTDKKQLMPKDLKESDFTNPGAKNETTPNPADKNPQKPADKKTFPIHPRL